jgi:hypothetical protein
MAHEIEPLVEDRLYRVGCTVGLDELSWVGRERPGFEPLNCYLFLDSDQAVFIDSCCAIAKPVVRDVLENLVAGRSVSIFPTRNEEDCIGNMDIVFTYGKNIHLLWGGAGGILEWINDPLVDPLVAKSFVGRIPFLNARNGVKTTIGEKINLEFYQAPLREMVMTQWAFDSTTKTLFTSDFFSWHHLDSADESPIVTSVGHNPSVEDVAADIDARINWLKDAHCPDAIEKFANFFEEREVEVIAPVHGAVLAGADVVRSNVALSLDALALLTV